MRDAISPHNLCQALVRMGLLRAGRSARLAAAERRDLVRCRPSRFWVPRRAGVGTGHYEAMKIY